MSRLTIDVFAEDRAHEEFLKALVLRLGEAERRSVRVQIRSARGGRPRVEREFHLYQKAVEHGTIRLPDILVVGIDADCSNPQDVQRNLREHLRTEFANRVTFACADPHVERWFMADPESFAAVVGVEPRRERRKCGRDRYKRQLVEAIRRGGHVPTLGGIEFARELAAAMDLYRAGKNEPSLKAWIDACRAAIRSVLES